MSDTNNGWPDKPGVPLNPGLPGAHWIKGYTEDAWMYDGDGGWWVPGYSHNLDAGTVAARYSYLGPCLTLDEAAALQARVTELEEMLSGLLKAFEGVGFRIGKTYPPRTASYEEAEQHYAKNYQGETALFMYQQWCQWRMACMARAALEGEKKDE